MYSPQCDYMDGFYATDRLEEKNDFFRQFEMGYHSDEEERETTYRNLQKLYGTRPTCSKGSVSPDQKKTTRDSRPPSRLSMYQDRDMSPSSEDEILRILEDSGYIEEAPKLSPIMKTQEKCESEMKFSQEGSSLERPKDFGFHTPVKKKSRSAKVHNTDPQMPTQLPTEMVSQLPPQMHSPITPTNNHMWYPGHSDWHPTQPGPSYSWNIHHNNPPPPYYLQPQMSTPDDPVIHSPPSIGAPPGMNGYHGGSGVKIEENPAACGSPEDGSMDNSEENRRRQKTCRVCGDHATGYNFNVITCESCKAFFRRNALRPKEFKCPYSEDCEINSVSRRFCQKCRLRKCFTVGMKKEWILNEEQLRRRKNSRLNNTTTSNKRVQPAIHQPSQTHQQSQQPHQSPVPHPGVAVYQQQNQRPLSINPMENQMMHHMQAGRQMPQLISPQGAQPYPLTSPVGSSASDSPPNRSLSMMHNGEKSPDGYDPNMMAHRISQTSLNPRPKMDNGQVVLSTEEYKQLLARIPGAQVPGLMNEEEPTNKRAAYNCNVHPMPADSTPPYSAPMSDICLSRNNSTSSGTNTDFGTYPSWSLGSSAPTQGSHFDIASFGMGIVTATGGADAAEEMYRKMNLFYDNIIQSALDSPENMAPKMQETSIPKPEYMHPTHGFQYETGQFPMQPADRNVHYQLNAAEAKALDVVREAFYGMDDPMEQGRQMQSFLKTNKSPADIMNIMDVTMRRFVKVAKGVPAFRDVSQEGKFSLLKGGMIEMLTVRGVTRYDPMTNSFKTPTIKGMNVSVNVDDMFAKLNANAQAQKAKCLEFFGFFDEEIKKNELAVYLVMLAVLFSVRAEPPMLESDVRIVTEQHNHFMSLLNRYLESLYGEQARRIFERLPKALGMLNDIARNAGMLFMGTVRSGEAEELPGEFFKIK